MQPNELKIEWTRIHSDINGNPRYVCHFYNLLTEQESNTLKFGDKYSAAIARAKKIGGKKFHNKQYGGGLCFQSYSLQDTEKRIFEELSAAMKKEEEAAQK